MEISGWVAGKLGPHVEESVLYGTQCGAEFRDLAGLENRRSDGCVEFVDIADRVYSDVVLRQSLVAEETGEPFVS